MKKIKDKIMVVTVGLLLTAVFSLTGLIFSAEAQTMNNNMQGLDARQHSIVSIAAFTAVGDMDKLKPALNQGLDAGLTVNEIKEILVQMYAYCGFPRSLNGIDAFMAVMDERAQKGVQDEEGPKAPVMPADLDRDEYGKNVRLKLAGRAEEAPPAGYQLFTPVIDSFLKEHLFADIFYCDNLDYLSRELATVAALASMHGTEGQQQFHFGAAMNMGANETQMRDLIAVIRTEISPDLGAAAEGVFLRVLSSRQ